MSSDLQDLSYGIQSVENQMHNLMFNLEDALGYIDHSKGQYGELGIPGREGPSGDGTPAPAVNSLAEGFRAINDMNIKFQRMARLIKDVRELHNEYLTVITPYKDLI